MKTMMKKLLLLLMFIPCGIYAQEMSGVVSDAMGPLPSVNVKVQGTSNGTTTDFDGNYALKNLKKGDKIDFSYIGYKVSTVVYNGQKSQNVTLQEDAKQLDEVVLVGYGSVKKKDATGSVTTVTAKDFNKGPVVSADQMIQGKVAGVQITNGGGAPGEGSQVRIRSGSSISASNDPLYVIDGVPVQNGGPSGGRNPLATINQNDIETITVLKDASATAIYGSRASNGVIIITTKRGKAGDLQVNYNGNFSVGTITKYVDVLNANEYKNYINEKLPSKAGLLGNSNTDWQKEIYRTAIGTDHNVALNGGNKGLTYRTSVGFTELNGLLKRDKMQRTTMSGGITQFLFNDNLKIELNTRTSVMKNNYSNGGAIGAAVTYDPTKPVYNEDGTFYQWPLEEALSGRNPVSLIEQFNNLGRSFRSIGNLQFEYKLPFLKELKAVTNFGYDYGSGATTNTTNPNWYRPQDRFNYSTGTSDNKNRLMDIYLNYNKSLGKVNLDLTSGYSYQNFRNSGWGYSENQDNLSKPYAERVTRGVSIVNMQSIFARANIGFYDKYLLTLSVRRDGTSRFVGETSPFATGTENLKFGTFPAAALAWKVKDESFLKNNKYISDLKLRLGWGITGQQDISTYPAVATYSISTLSNQYMFGGQPIRVIRPNSYNPLLKWEETTTQNIGVDYGLFKNRLTGTVDYYRRNTKDLLFYVANPVGVGFSNYDNYNAGNLLNYGVEVMANVLVIDKEDMRWNVGGNWTYQHSNIEEIFADVDENFPGIFTGGISGGTGNLVQNLQTGYAPNTFYVYEQKYDSNGRPLEGMFVDRNGDGLVNTLDLYRYKKPAADFFFGFNTDFTYKAWDLSMVWRGSLNNYLYNNVQSQRGNSFEASPVGNFINNVNQNAVETGFVEPQYLSDYYVQKASFLRWDNVSLGYNFKDAIPYTSNMKVSATVQNVLVITKYEGLDPEVNGGIDNSIYPRPRTFMLGVNVNF